MGASSGQNKKIPDQFRSKDVPGGDPGAFLWAIAFPVHQVLKESPYSMRVQYPMDCVSRLAANDPRRRGRSDCRSKRRRNNRFRKDTWKVGLIFSDLGKNK